MIAWCMSLALAGELQPTLDEVQPLRGVRLAEAAPTIPGDTYDKALSGSIVTGLESVEGSPVRKAWGVGVLPVPIDALWGAINDDHSKVRVTRLSHLAVLEGETCSSRRVVFQYLPVSMLTDRWWVVEQRANMQLAEQSAGKVRELVWKSVDDAPSRLDDETRAVAAGGMELPMTQGGWLLIALPDGQTLVEYYTWSDPGGAVPAGLASRFAAGGIEDTISAMATLASDGPGCKGP